MKRIELIHPTLLFIDHLDNYFDNSLEYIEKIIHLLNQENWDLSEGVGVDQTKNSLLHLQNEYYGITNTINLILDSIKKDFNFDTERFSINQMWANNSKLNRSHPMHYHPNSFFSGIVYLTSGSKTYFQDPVMFRLSSQIQVSSDLDNPMFEIEPNPGQIVIFPSWLYHGTQQNKIENRMTISFNSIPEGKTNFKNSNNRLSQLNVYQGENK
jgi:uncharacterized protein (TIGR02466 family)